MARIPMVTRTITSTNATIMCVNTSTKQVEEVSKVLPRTYADDNAILKYIEKHNVFEGTELKPVSVVSSVVFKALYGMREEEFVQVAKPLTADEAQDAQDDEDQTEAEVEQPKPSKKSKK